MRAAILQSSYLPWKGYFDIIASVDAFIFFDDVQYTPNDWRNRNRFKFSGGVSWLSIPCGKRRHRRICDVTVADPAWQQKHWQAIRQNYGKCPYFGKYEPYFEDLFLSRTWPNLSELNQHTIKHIAKEFLGLSTEFLDSRSLQSEGVKSERLVSILKQLESKVDVYVSGPSARNYIQDEVFHEAGIVVEYVDYSGYPEYPQRFPPFRHDVSILDLLFNVGPEAPEYIWGWRKAPRSAGATESKPLAV